LRGGSFFVVADLRISHHPRDRCLLSDAIGVAGRALTPLGWHLQAWPDWYAEYIVREQAGKELPS
jgi:hypothetical protein